METGCGMGQQKLSGVQRIIFLHSHMCGRGCQAAWEPFGLFRCLSLWLYDTDRCILHSAVTLNGIEWLYFSASLTHILADGVTLNWCNTNSPSPLYNMTSLISGHMFISGLEGDCP